MALAYDYITAITQDKYIPRMVDNIYESSALLSMMRRDGRILNGGTEIVQPLLYAKNTSRGGFTGYEVFNVSPPDNLTAAKYDWAQYYVSISLAGLDEIKNSGDSAVLNLLEIKMKDAEMSMLDQLATDLFSGTTHIIGLASAVDATTTYGGIAVADFAGWASGEDGTAHTAANMKDSTNAAYAHTLFRTAWKSCNHLNKSPNLIITSQEVFDIYEQTLQANARYPLTARGKFLADAGFTTVEFRGIPVVVDDFCPDGTDSYCYFLNTDFLNLYISPKQNFKFTGFKVPTNQDARVGQILVAAQLGLSNRRMFYKFTDLGN